jgi:hypothetical protein
LSLLAHFGKDGRSEVAIPKINQETLAEMVGTTRGRVNFFMNKFRKLGFVGYQTGGEFPSQRCSPRLGLAPKSVFPSLRSVVESSRDGASCFCVLYKPYPVDSAHSNSEQAADELLAPAFGD